MVGPSRLTDPRRPLSGSCRPGCHAGFRSFWTFRATLIGTMLRRRFRPGSFQTRIVDWTGTRSAGAVVSPPDPPVLAPEPEPEPVPDPPPGALVLPDDRMPLDPAPPDCGDCAPVPAPGVVPEDGLVGGAEMPPDGDDPPGCAGVPEGRGAEVVVSGVVGEPADGGVPPPVAAVPPPPGVGGGAGAVGGVADGRMVGVMGVPPGSVAVGADVAGFVVVGERTVCTSGGGDETSGPPWPPAATEWAVPPAGWSRCGVRRMSRATGSTMRGTRLAGAWARLV
ncbi:hypothetical protein FAIPA1_90016 [Frankia sp. AiPs1]